MGLRNQNDPDKIAEPQSSNFVTPNQSDNVYFLIEMDSLRECKKFLEVKKVLGRGYKILFDLLD